MGITEQLMMQRELEEEARKKMKHEPWMTNQLPKDMTGKTFLDVGCWNGMMCYEARLRGAKHAVGIDLVMPKTAQQDKIRFFPMDVFSEKFLELPKFDIVLCAGLLYHVANPMGLLHRLHLVTGKLLVLETAVRPNPPKPCVAVPLMEFCPGDSFDNNYSNWWLPNVPCVTEMLSAARLCDVQLIYEKQGRACFHATPVNAISAKILPRRQERLDG